MRVSRANSPKHYLRQYVLFGFLVGLLVVGFTAVVNPYGISPLRTSYPGFNYMKPARVFTCRTVKSYDLNDESKPDAIVVGQSRIPWGINTTYYNDTRKKYLYNGGLPGSNAEEHYLYISAWLRQAPSIKKIYLEVHPFAYDVASSTPRNFVRDRIGRRFFKFDDFIFLFCSVSSIKDSAQTISFNTTPFPLQEPPRLYDTGNGQHHLPVRPAGEWLYYNIQDRPFFNIRPRNSTRHFQLNPVFIDLMKELVAKCKLDNIELMLFTSAENVLWSEESFQQNARKEVDDFLRLVAGIHPLYFFSGFSAENADIHNFWDHTHWRPTLGNVMFNYMDGRLKAKEGSTFGYRIDSQNVDSFLKLLYSERDGWVKNNPKQASILYSAYLVKTSDKLQIKAIDASESLSGYGANHLHDGLPFSGTPWSSNLSDAQADFSLRADLGSIQETSAFAFIPGTVVEYFPKSFVVEASLDGVDWEEIAAETAYRPLANVWYQCPTPKKSYRYFRVRGQTQYHAGLKKWAVQIREIEIYGPRKDVAGEDDHSTGQVNSDPVSVR